MVKDKILPLRTGVGIILINNQNKIFVAKRIDNPIDKWQMPQGGVEPREELVEAMKRELVEETSIESIKILKEINCWLEYELPQNLLGKIWKGRFRGQKQKWFIVKFTGSEKEINLCTKYPEFMEWKWIKVDELTNVVVDFKKDVYKKLIIEIKKIIT
jgi:putative (di)nucleoside polyphosphate hydrolase